MAGRSTPSLNDVRGMTRLLGQVAEHSSRHLQQQVFLRQTAELIGVRVGIAFTCQFPRPSQIDIQVLASEGWTSDKERRLFALDAIQHSYKANPFFQAVSSRLQEAHDSSWGAWRRQLVCDAIWYGNEYVQQAYRPLNIDNLLLTLAQGLKPGDWTGLALLRSWGDKTRFNEKDLSITTLLHQAVSFLYQPQPAYEPTLPDDLSPRLAEVLRLLVHGDSEKEVAVKLGLSPLTIHRHVSRLYRCFNVNSRAELIARLWSGANTSGIIG